MVASYAETKSVSSNPPIVLTPKKGSGGNGHRSPGISFMTGYYDAGTLSFDGISHYGVVSVEVTHQNSRVMWFAFPDEENSSTEVGTMPEIYSIVVTNENGSYLYGTFEVE